MVWWPYLYVALLSYVGFGSVRTSAQEHGVGVATGLEVITSVAWSLLVAAFFSPWLAARLGRAAAPLYAVAALWTAYTVWRDFRPTAMAARLPAENRTVIYRGVVAYCAALVVPIVVLGAIVVRRAFRAD